MSNTNRQWVLASRPVGMLRESDFELREAAVPEPGADEILVRVLDLSFDPTQRGWVSEGPGYMPPVQIGEVMRAGAVGQVVKSNHGDFEPGDLVQGTFGWQEYCALPPASPMWAVTKLPKGVPPRWALGVLGITGMTAYFGMLDVARPQKGENVVVSAAAGATGSIAGQIARLEGCRVIGIAGGPEKCRWVVDEARFDECIDYKREDVAARLGELCPAGIAVYFDNVGGEILEAALGNLALGARIALCGGISSYNDAQPPPGPRNLLSLIIKRARMEGFLIFDYVDQFPEAIERLGKWVQSGEIVHREDVQHGFENIPKTLVRLFEGRNLGKQLLSLADPE